MSAESRMELSRRNNDAAARAHTPLRHVQGKTLNLGPVPFKYLQEDFGAAVLPIKPLSDKQCRLRYVALVQAASVTDVKVDEVAADQGMTLDLLQESSRVSAILQRCRFQGFRSAEVITMPRFV